MAETDNDVELPERIWIDRTSLKRGNGYIYPMNPDNADWDSAPIEYTRATAAAPLESYKYGPTEAALRNQAENIIFTVFPPVRNIHTDSALAELRQLITLALITAYRSGAPEPPDLAAEAELRLRAVACAARDFIWEPENWEAWQDAKESNSVAWPPEFLMLAQAVEKKFGPMPIDDDDKEPTNET